MRPFAKPFYLVLGYSCVVLAGLGVVLPLLPTTLVAWREHRIIPRRAKIAAVTAMLASFVLAWVTVGHPLVLLSLALIMGSVSVYILTRPSGR